MKNSCFDLEVAFARFSGNREGVVVVAALRNNTRHLSVRWCWCNWWIGVRYTDFSPYPWRWITVQVVPCLGIGLGWKVEARP